MQSCVENPMSKQEKKKNEKGWSGDGIEWNKP
jgi:hypothetical protein